MVKVTPSGFLGPAGVEGAGSVDPVAAEVAVARAAFSGSKAQLLAKMSSRATTPRAARARAALPEVPFFRCSVKNAHSPVQLVPSK